MNIKQIRKFIHNNEFNKIPKLLLKNDTVNIPNIDYLNSIISGISKITIWDIETISFKDFIRLILSKTITLKYTETTYTALINLFSNELINDLDKSIEYLKIMMNENIIIKQRTLYPLFNNCFNNKNSKINDLYLLSKINNNNISCINYLQLIEFNKTNFTLIEIVKDFCNNYDVLENENILFLQKCFDNYPSKKNEIELNKYQISNKNKKDLLIQIEHFIKLSLKNKISISKFTKYLNTIKKNNLLIIDGANVGFYNQGINSGIKLNWKQLNIFVDNLIKINENNILLILNSRHFANLNAEEKKIIQKLEKTINIYKTVRGVDDDLFWLYSSIYIDNSRILTNDEITNHLFYLNNTILKDYKKYKIINYDLNDMEPIFKFPPQFLQKIYFNNNKLIIPYNKKDDSIIYWHTFNLI